MSIFKINSIFTLISSSEINNINNLSIKLINIDSNEEISNSISYSNNIIEDSFYYYKYTINTKNLNEGKYLIKFNEINLNEYLIITHEKEVNNIIGTFQ